MDNKTRANEVGFAAWQASKAHTTNRAPPQSGYAIMSRVGTIMRTTSAWLYYHIQATLSCRSSWTYQSIHSVSTWQETPWIEVKGVLWSAQVVVVVAAALL